MNNGFAKAKPLFFHETNDILHLAIQSITQGIQGFCADGFSLLDPVQGIGRKTLLENQTILRYVFSEKGFIKRIISDHSHHQSKYIMLKRLTILNILSIIKKRGVILWTMK